MLHIRHLISVFLIASTTQAWGSYFNITALEKKPQMDPPAKAGQANYSPSKEVPPMIEVKGGYFFFSSRTMRKIYDEGGADVQISGSYPLWKWLQIYGSVEWLERHGRTLGAHEKVSIWEIPLSLGLKPVIVITPKMHYYFTLGPRYFFVHVHASSHLGNNTNQNGLGGFVNTGLNFFPIPHLVVDVFGEFSYKRMRFTSAKHHVHGQKAQVGGFLLGVGLGYAF